MCDYIMAVETRHQKSCSKQANKKARCNCTPSFRAVAYKGSVEGKRQRVIKLFSEKPAAQAWLTSTEAKKASVRRSGDVPTLRDAAVSLWAGMYDGSVLNRQRMRYKRTATQTLEGAYKRYVDDELGAYRLDQIRRKDMQKLVDRLAKSGRKPATIHNAVKPVSAIYRRAIRDGVVLEDPCQGLEVERARGSRDRIAAPSEVKALLAALPLELRVLYGLAAYAGLRRGEIMGLRWEDVDFDQGIIHVRQQKDVRNGEFIETKSRAWRRVPILSELRKLLKEWEPQSTGSMVLDPGVAFRTLDRRAYKAWKDAKLKRISLHELRHSFASICIDAGLNLKQIGSFLGHKSVTTTMDIYGHLLPGSEQSAAAVMDEYLENAKKPEASTRDTPGLAA